MSALLSGTLLIFRTHLAGLVLSRRSLICLALAALPPALAIFPARQEDALSVVVIIGSLMLLMGIAPLVGLLSGSAVVTEEIENRTITYVVTRPVPRAALFLGRWTATLIVTTALLATSAVSVGEIARAPRPSDVEGRLEHRHARRATGEEQRVEIDRSLPEGLVLRSAIAASLAGALYSLLTAGLGVFLRRPMIVGLGYAFAVEGFLGIIPGSTQKLSLQYYLRGILADLGKPPHPGFWSEVPMYARTTFLSPTESGLRLALVLVLAVGFCTWAIQRRQFVVSA